MDTATIVGLTLSSALILLAGPVVYCLQRGLDRYRLGAAANELSAINYRNDRDRLADLLKRAESELAGARQAAAESRESQRHLLDELNGMRIGLAEAQKLAEEEAAGREDAAARARGLAMARDKADEANVELVRQLNAAAAHAAALEKKLAAAQAASAEAERLRRDEALLREGALQKLRESEGRLREYAGWARDVADWATEVMAVNLYGRDWFGKAGDRAFLDWDGAAPAAREFWMNRARTAAVEVIGLRLPPAPDEPAAPRDDESPAAPVKEDES